MRDKAELDRKCQTALRPPLIDVGALLADYSKVQATVYFMSKTSGHDAVREHTDIVAGFRLRIADPSIPVIVNRDHSQVLLVWVKKA